MAIRHNLIASSSYLSVYYPLRHLLISIIIPFVIPIRTASFRLTVRRQNKSSPFIVHLFLSPSSMLVYTHTYIYIQIIFVEHPWRFETWYAKTWSVLFINTFEVGTKEVAGYWGGGGYWFSVSRKNNCKTTRNASKFKMVDVIRDLYRTYAYAKGKPDIWRIFFFVFLKKIPVRNRRIRNRKNLYFRKCVYNFYNQDLNKA